MNLWSETYRPKRMETIVLSDRVLKMLNNPSCNFIFYGHYGTGKTTVSRILSGKYADAQVLEINTSMYNSVEILRTQIKDFCSTMSISLSDTADAGKWVILDEFDGASSTFQDALKKEIEEYNRHKIRFIFITNYLEKVSAAIKSRSVEVCFDPQTEAEKNELKSKIRERLVGAIFKHEGIVLGEPTKLGTIITEEQVVAIINSKFPDFRAIINTAQALVCTGGVGKGGASLDKNMEDLFVVVLSANKSPMDIYHFVMEEIGAESIGNMLEAFGKPFMDWCAKNQKQQYMPLFFDIAAQICVHKTMLPNMADPIVLGLSFIGKLRQLLKVA